MPNTRKSIDYLFISKVRIKSLKYFFFQPEKPIHLRGAVREFNEEINAVRRELNRLEEIKLLTTEKKGNRKYYSLNKKHPFFDDLLSIMHKTFGLGGDIVKSAKKLGDIKYAILTNSYLGDAEGKPQDVDLVMVGDIDLNLLGEIISNAEKRIGKEVNYTVLTHHEFEIRKKRRDAFVQELLASNNILLLGNSTELKN